MHRYHKKGCLKRTCISCRHNIEDLFVNNASILNESVQNSSIQNLRASNAEVQNLRATNGDVGVLQGNTASFRQGFALYDSGPVNTAFGPVAPGVVVSKNLAGEIVRGFALDVPVSTPVAILDPTGYQLLRWFGPGDETYFQLSLSAGLAVPPVLGTLFRVDPATEKSVAGPSRSLNPPMTNINFSLNMVDLCRVGTYGLITFWSKNPMNLLAFPVLINGLDFTVGATVVVAGPGTVAYIRVAALDDNRFVIVFSRLNGPQVIAVAGSITNGVITLGAQVLIGQAPPGSVVNGLRNLIINERDNGLGVSTLSIGFIPTDAVAFFSCFQVTGTVVVATGSLDLFDLFPRVDNNDQYCLVGIRRDVFLVAATSSTSATTTGGGLILASIAIDESGVPSPPGDPVSVDTPQGGLIFVEGLAGVENKPFLVETQEGFPGQAVVRQFAVAPGNFNQISVTSTKNITRYPLNTLSTFLGQPLPYNIEIGVQTIIAWFSGYPVSGRQAHLALLTGLEGFQFASRLQGNAVLGMVVSVSQQGQATVCILGTATVESGVTLIPGRTYYVQGDGTLVLNQGLNVPLSIQTLPIGTALNTRTLLLKG